MWCGIIRQSSNQNHFCPSSFHIFLHNPKMCIVTKHKKTPSYIQWSPVITTIVIFLLFHLSIDLIRQIKAKNLPHYKKYFPFFPIELPINIINLLNRMNVSRMLNNLSRTHVSIVNIKPSLPLHHVTIMTDLEHVIIIL